MLYFVIECVSCFHLSYKFCIPHHFIAPSMDLVEGWLWCTLRTWCVCRKIRYECECECVWKNANCCLFNSRTGIKHSYVCYVINIFIIIKLLLLLWSLSGNGGMHAFTARLLYFHAIKSNKIQIMRSLWLCFFSDLFLLLKNKGSLRFNLFATSANVASKRSNTRYILRCSRSVLCTVLLIFPSTQMFI